jgi:hypothetical protein
MPCLFAFVAAAFPRVGSLILWLARPMMFTRAFNGSWFWPLLGIIFLPFTTLMYVILWSATGLSGWDVLWVVLAVLIDISHWTSTAYQNRGRIPGYSASYPTGTNPM